MRRTTKALVGSLVLLTVAGIAAWADPVPLDPPQIPEPKTLQRNSDDGDVTQLRPTIGAAVEAAPIVPPIQQNSFSGAGDRGGGFAGMSGSMGSTGGGGASVARASVERSLRRLTETLR